MRRQIINVAPGTQDTDAANVGQLKAAGLIGDGGSSLPAVTYDDAGKTSVTLGSAGTPVAIHNVAAGDLSATSTDVMNGSQLYATNNRVGSLEDSLSAGGVIDPTTGKSLAVTYNDGTKSSVTLGGAGASSPVQLKNVADATDANDGVNLSQLNKAVTDGNPYMGGRGTGVAAQSTAIGAVALGLGSVANQINTISVGNAATGLQRRITNVADGQSDHDAATIGQVNNLVGGATKTMAEALDNTISTMGARFGTPSTRAAIADSYVKVDGQGDGSDNANVTPGSYGIAIGADVNTTGTTAVSIGASSSSTATASVALGAGATATGNNALAFGGSSSASGPNAIGLGAGTVASQNSSVAMGFNARSLAANAIALGTAASASATGSVALGTLSQVDSAATNGVAVGRQASVTSAGINSVALGVGSVADRSNTVSVGSTTQQRQITNVSSGTADSDAVNVKQLKDYVADNGGGSSNPLDVAYDDASKKAVTLGNTGTPVAIHNVAAGAVGATSRDAINGSQLHSTSNSVANALGGGSKVTTDGTVSVPSYKIGGTTANTVGDALTNLDGRTTVNTGNISDLKDKLAGSGLVDDNGNSLAAVAYDKSVDGTPNYASVTLGGADAISAVTLKNVANGVDDHDAVNVSQLKSAGIIGDDEEGNLTSLVLSYTDATKTRVALAGEGGTTITNVKAGAVSATSTDAINGSQLHGTAQSVADVLGGGAKVNTDGTLEAPKYRVGGTEMHSVGDALTNLDGRVTGNTTEVTNLDDRVKTNEGDITTIQTQLTELGNETTGLVQQDATTKQITVAKVGDGDVVDFKGTAGTRRLSGVSTGRVDTDAATVGQLRGAATVLGTTIDEIGKFVAPKYTVAGKTVGTVSEAVSNLDGRTTTNTGAITDLKDKLAATGLIDGNGDTLTAVTYDKNADGTPNYDAIMLGGGKAAGPVALKNVAQGVDGTDAVNIDQLTDATQSIRNELADGTLDMKYIKVNATGTQANAMGLNSVAIGSGANANGIGALALGTGSRAAAMGAVAIGQNSVANQANTVSVGSLGNERKIVNVANGDVNADSTDAVNGSQLYDALNSLTSTFDEKSHQLSSRSARSVGIDSISTMDVSDPLVAVEGLKGNNLASLNGADPATTTAAAIGASSAASGGNAVAVGLQSIAGSDNAVAIGSFAQTGADQSYAVAMGSDVQTNGTEAVAIGAHVQANADNALAVGNNNAYALSKSSIALGDGARVRAGADNSIAVGKSAGIATNVTNALALGPDASVQAGANGGIALGQGSVANRGNALSIGGRTVGQRQIINVAAGTQRTDAVNVAQLTGVTNALGGGAAVGADGSVVQPTYTVDGKQYSTVGDALGALAASGGTDPNAVAYDDATKAKVTLGGKDGTTIANVAAGAVNATSQDAINGAQLHGTAQSVADALGGGAKVKADGTLDAPTFKVGGTDVRSVGDALTNLDGRTTTNTGDIAGLRDKLSNSGLVDPTTGTAIAAVTYDRNKDGTANRGSVTLGGADATGPVALKNVADGVDGYDAVNVTQLTSGLSSLKDELTNGAIDLKFIKVNADPATGASAVVSGAQAVAIGTGAAGTGAHALALGTGARASATDAIAIGYNSVASQANTVSIGRLGAERRIVHVANGNVSSESTDAINGGQLYDAMYSLSSTMDTKTQRAIDSFSSSLGEKTQVAIDKMNAKSAQLRDVRDPLVAIEGQTGMNNASLNGADPATTSAVAVGVNSMAAGGDTIAVGLQSYAAADNSVAIGSFAQTGADQSYSVAMGSDAQTNGTQAVALGAHVQANADNALAVGSNAAAVGTSSIALGDGALTRAGTTNSVAIGKKANVATKVADAIALGTNATVAAGATGGIALGAGSIANRANALSIGSVGAERQIINVAAGTQQTDAVNVSQLKGVTNALGGGATVGTDGSIGQPVYTVDGKQYNTVSDALDAVAASGGGTPADGAVAYDDTSKSIVTLAGTTGTTIGNVAAGEVSATSMDAINGSQLHGTAQRMADAFGGGSTVNSDGAIGAPTYTVGGTDVHNVGDALTNLDGRVTTNTGGIAGLKDQLAGSGLVDPTTGQSIAGVTYDRNTDGTPNRGSVTLGGADATGPVALKNVANGVDDHDAVNVSQLKSAGLVGDDGSGDLTSLAVTYDDASKDKATLVGTNGTTLTNVAAGAVNATSMDAINGSQLHGTAQSAADSIGGGTMVDADGKLAGTAIEVNGYKYSTISEAVQAAAAYGATDSLAVRYDLNGDGTANYGSVTLGGTGAAPVVLTNVANGVNQYDAVNFGQLSELSDRIGGMDDRVVQLEQGGGGSGGGSGGENGSIVAPNPGDGNGEVAIGSGSTIGEGVSDGTAVGSNSNVGGTGGTAIGSGSSAADAGSTAIGQGSSVVAGAGNSVAIGQGSTATEANTVSFGSAGNERRLVNVADGINATDGATKGQLDRAVGGLQGQINDVSKNAYSGIAAATALTMIPGVDPGKNLSFGIGGATYKGYQAVALGGEARITQNLKMKAGVGLSSGGNTVGVGASYQW